MDKEKRQVICDMIMTHNFQLKDKHIVARLNGEVVGREDVKIGKTFLDWILDERFKWDDLAGHIESSYTIDEQKKLRDGGLSPEEKKIARENRARNKLAEELGYENFEEMKEDVRAMKRARMERHINSEEV